MKKVIILALAVMAGASSVVAGGAKKKQVQKIPVETALKLNSSIDSVSYAAGKAMTQGLVPFIQQQNGVDTAYMADFVRGFKEAVEKGKDPKFTAYATGLQIASQVSRQMLPNMSAQFKDTPDSINKEVFYKGFEDALLNNNTLMTSKVAEKYFKEKMEADKAAKTEKLYGANRKAGEDFLAANAKKDSVVVLPDGLQYKILVNGTGASPKETDKVKVKYEGKLIDGTEFDSSYKRGDGTTTFGANQVIKGWTEALTKMQVGSKWQLFIPYKLAYGEREAGQIKPFSALVFTVELVEINPEAKAKVENTANAKDSKTKEAKANAKAAKNAKKK
jgi:FKBP-type peptidyl-prolyl cis-trans isomerase FklB